MSEFIKSRALKIILAVLGSFIVLLGSFCLGVNVGAHKAGHFSRWCDDMQRGFNPPGGPMAMPFRENAMPGGHGVFGKVLSVTSSTVMIQGRDNIEQDVLVASSTAIRLGRDSVTIGDIKPDMQASVIGAPNDHGQIEAKLIRLLPAK